MIQNLILESCLTKEPEENVWFVLFKSKLLQFLFFTSNLSTTSTEKPKLPQRMADAVKSYIYTPEEGKHVAAWVFFSLSFSRPRLNWLFSHHFFFVFFTTAFRFPLKLAISAVVSVIALYQVTVQVVVVLHGLQCVRLRWNVWRREVKWKHTLSK